MCILAQFMKIMPENQEFPENRRIKTIHLTEKGKQYAETLIPHIHKADCKAMEALSEEQQDTILELMDIYVKRIRNQSIKEWYVGSCHMCKW